MLKKVGLVVLAVVSMAFADSDVFIRNICDTLGDRKVDLQLLQLEETMWYGSKDLNHRDSGKVTVYKNYQDAKILYKNPPAGESLKLPVSVSAGCLASRYNLFQYAAWSNSKWSLTDDDDDYATMIMDIHQHRFPGSGYDSTNAFNVLAIRKGTLPEDGSYSSDELMFSKTFEFRFDWWYSVALYTEKSVRVEGNTQYTTSRNHFSTAVATDSLSAVKNSMKYLNVPDSISKVQLQVFHAVLVDPKKDVPEPSSSETVVQESSSSFVPSSSASVVPPSSSSTGFSSSSFETVVPGSSSTEGLSSADESLASSASENDDSSSSSDVSGNCNVDTDPYCVPPSSSSAEETTVIGGGLWTFQPLSRYQREIRRLDGSRVEAGEILEPGVYYVKGTDGRWKKQIKVPR